MTAGELPPDPVADAWEVLCVATMRLGRAAAMFRDARARYLATNPYGAAQSGPDQAAPLPRS